VFSESSSTEPSKYPDRSAVTLRIPGVASILADFGQPVALLDNPGPAVGFDYRFSTMSMDGLVWAVQVETVRSDVARTSVRTARALPVRTGAINRDTLLRESLAEFVSNVDLDGEHDAVSAAAQAVDAARRAVDAARAGVDGSPLRPHHLIIDNETYEAVAIHHAGHAGVAADYRELVVVAVVPADELDTLRLGTIVARAT
jgi:hypothetical protein